MVLILLITLIGSQAQSAEWIPINPGSQPSESSVFLEENTADHMLIRWEIQGAFRNEIVIEGDKYQQYSLKNLMQTYNGAPGDPSLPMLVEIIHVPYMMKGTVEIVQAKWVDIANGVVVPQQYPSRDDGSTPPPFYLNEESYSQSEPFPTAQVSTNPPQGWGGIAVSSVGVTPIRYFPSENRIQLANSITVRVNFEPGIQNIVRPRRINPQMQKLHQIALLNPPPINRPLDADDNEVVRMLFIMKDEALETTQPLIDFHHSTGLRTEVIFSDDLPDDDEEAAGELKDIIRERFEGGVEFVQIIGEPRERAWDVPMLEWGPEDPGAQDNVSTVSHSDSWYVCIDGPGEFGFEDHLPELAIGRLTYESSDDLDELEIQIAKLTDYLSWNFDNRDQVVWLNNSLLVAGVGRDDEYIRCKEAIADFDYELNAPEFITLFGNDNAARNQAVIDIINDDGVGFVNYRGHGNEPRWARWNNGNEDFRVAQVRQLNNRNRPFILTSSACLNASIAERGADCLVENFQKQSGGSVSAHGSIISSYTISNSFFDEAIYKAWFDEGVKSLGYASNLAGTQMVLHFDIPFDNPRVYNSLGRMNFRTYIWLGDPALEYRLGDQVQLAVEIPEVILINTEFIYVSVTDQAGNAIENSRVCVRSEDDAIYQVSISDENGVARISFDPGMEGAGELLWAVQHRNGDLVEGNIVVSDGFGGIAGRVLELGNDDVVPAAELRLTPFNVLAVSNDEGAFFFDGIPERGNYSIVISAEGYHSLQRDGINVIDDEVTEIDFRMAYSLLEPSEDSIVIEIGEGEDRETSLTITNTGTGNLSWSSWLTDDYDFELYEMINNEDLSLELDDVTINGVVLIGEYYYVTGGNNFSDPNYVYKIDRESGRLEDSFAQPTAGIGFHDLATDGEYIYGSASSIIYQMNLDGEIVREIEGPYNPNVALALDNDGNIWVAYNNGALIKIDMDGNVLQEIQNDEMVRALAWSPVDEFGFNLKMMVLGDNNVPTLYQANPETGDVTFAIEFPVVEDGETPADALFITNQYNPPAWSIVGMVKSDILRYLRVWHLHYDADWISTAPEAGGIEPDNSEEIMITISSENLDPGTILTATLGLENNGREPLIEIPITLEVEVSVDSEDNSIIPTEFGIVGAYPNPFNAFTKINFDITVSGHVTASVYDLQGRNILTIIDTNMQAGSHSALIDGNLLSTGVYIVKLISGGDIATQKIVLIK